MVNSECRLSYFPAAFRPRKGPGAVWGPGAARQLETELLQKERSKTGVAESVARAAPNWGPQGGALFCDAAERGSSAKARPKKMTTADVGVRSRTVCLAASHFPRHMGAPETWHGKRMRQGQCCGAPLLLVPQWLLRNAARGSNAADAHVARTVHMCCVIFGLHALCSVSAPGNAVPASAASRQRFLTAVAEGATRKRKRLLKRSGEHRRVRSACGLLGHWHSFAMQATV